MHRASFNCTLCEPEEYHLQKGEVNAAKQQCRYVRGILKYVEHTRRICSTLILNAFFSRCLQPDMPKYRGKTPLYHRRGVHLGIAGSVVGVKYWMCSPPNMARAFGTPGEQQI